MMLWKCCTQYASKFGKLSSGHSTGSQFSFQSQRKAMPKNIQTTTQLHSSHTVAKWYSKFSKGGFKSTWTKNFQDVQGGFRKGRGTRDQIANICWITEKARKSQKNIYFCFIDYAKAFDCVDHKRNCGKFFKRWEYQTTWPASWEICIRSRSNRTSYVKTDWFKIGKGLRQGCILSPCLFYLYAEYIMRYAGLDEAQAGIKIAGRNINNLRSADDTTLRAQSEEELKSLLMKVK